MPLAPRTQNTKSCYHKSTLSEDKFRLITSTLHVQQANQGTSISLRCNFHGITVGSHYMQGTESVTICANWQLKLQNDNKDTI